MKTKLEKVLAVILILAMSVSLLAACGSSSAPASVDATPVPVEPIAEEDPAVAGLTDEQKASMAMLNYLAYVVQEINASRNSRAVLEEVFDSLLNDVEPSGVDVETQKALNNIFETIKKYRMNDFDRERLEFLNDQGSALSIITAIPNPLEVLDSVAERGTLRTLASVAYSALGVVAESSETSAEELLYLERKWSLDDTEEKALMDSRTDMFNYMVTIAQGLPKGITLSENDIADFVTQVNSSGPAAKLDWLRNHQEKYQYFSYYWLELADAYYDMGDYSGCLSAIATYRDRDTGIFKLDKRLAQSLKKGIVAAQESLSGSEREQVVADFADTIVANIGTDDWELRYYAAQTYLSLYAETENKAYLEKAYNEAKNNVRYLVPVQKKQNSDYIAEVQEISVSKDADKEESGIIKAYNKYLKERRNTELLPVYEPLLLNCELLFSLADKLDISQDEKNVIDSILHDEPVFLSYELDQRFSFSERKGIEALSADSLSFTGVLKDQKLTIPVVFAPNGTKIKAVVNTNGKEYNLDNWTVYEVDRKKSHDIGDFEAVFTCKSDDMFKFREGDTITLTLIPPGSVSEENSTTIKLVVDNVTVLGGVHFKEVE